MSAQISLVSVNIEGRKHLDLVLPFIRTRKPDVLCVQEICKQDLPAFEDAVGATGHFAPKSFVEKWGDEQGTALFTVLPHTARIEWYAGHDGKQTVTCDESSREATYRTNAYWLVSADIEKEGERFTIGTTHFPVTDEGAGTWYQREALDGLFRALADHKEIVFCGDLNAPRGREIFDTIASRYHDNIPPEYTTSLDGDIHRAGPIPFVVDACFSTPGYQVSNVEYVCGVSDHCAISATISQK